MKGKRLRFAPRALVSMALLLASGLPLGAEPSYYVSDAAAFEGEALQGPDGAEEYVLEVTKDAASETRVLLHNGKEIERRVLSWKGEARLERQFKGGNLVEEESYGASGEPLKEKVYKLNPNSEKPELFETRVYHYGSAIAALSGEAVSLLSKVEAFDGSGAAKGSLEYRYDARSRLVEVRASGSFGREAAGAVVGSKGLAAAWIGMGEDSVFVASYEGGRPLLEAVYDKDGKARSTQSYRYGEKGELASTSLSDQESGKLTETSYDSGGRPSLIAVRLGASTLSRRELRYDEKGRVVEDDLLEQDASVEKSSSYSEAGVASRVVTKKGGIIQSSESVSPDSSSVKELYDRGELFLRVYSKAGRIVREEFVTEGSVVRVRVFP
jgi:hypothetical protein